MKNLSGLMAVLALFLCASTSYGQLYEKRINCGSSTTSDVTFLNEDFTADTQATGFTSTANLVSNNLSHNGLAEPQKSIRYTKNGSMNYNFTNLPSGTYTVKLHFAEVYWGVAPGHGATEEDVRHFEIDIDGQWSTPDFNIFNASGGNSYHTISQDVTVNNGSLLITFTAIAGKNDPIINAIEILEQAPTTIPVTSVSLDVTAATIDINADQQLTATILPSNASDPAIQWSSSDIAVATVSATGLVSPLIVGTTTITATNLASNISATSVVEVTDASNPSTGGNWSLSGGSAYRLSGNVGIGTTNPVPTNGDPNYKLAVNGSVRAKEVKVETGWADYVFFNDYKLPTLQEVEQHIQEKGHLINIPSAAEVEANGIELGEMNKLLLEKIEELTLYVIQQEKRIKALEKE